MVRILRHETSRGAMLTFGVPRLNLAARSSPPGVRRRPGANGVLVGLPAGAPPGAGRPARYLRMNRPHRFAHLFVTLARPSATSPMISVTFVVASYTFFAMSMSRRIVNR